MGGILGKKCKVFVEEFPNNLHKASLPYIVGDLLDITCTKEKNKILLNILGNIGLMVASGALSKVKAIEALQGIFPPIFSADPQLNAAVLYYILSNAILIIIDFANPVEVDTLKKRYAEEGVAGIISECTNPFKCIGVATEAVAGAIKGAYKNPGKQHVDANCRKNEEEVGGYCYPKCPDDYTGEGDYCYPKCPKGFEDIGDNKCKRKRIKADEKDKIISCPPGTEAFSPMPGHTKGNTQCYAKCPEGLRHIDRCTCAPPGEFSIHPEGLVNIPGSGIENVRFGHECTEENGVNFNLVPPFFTDFIKDKGKGWRKISDTMCQKGGIITNCELYGRIIERDMVCPEGSIEINGKCYGTDKEGYECKEDGYCYKECPPGYYKEGDHCIKTGIYRGYPKRQIGVCEDYYLQIGDKCYLPCGIGFTQDLTNEKKCWREGKDVSKTDEDYLKRLVYAEMELRKPFISDDDRDKYIADIITAQNHLGLRGQSVTEEYILSLDLPREEFLRQRKITQFIKEDPVLRVDKQELLNTVRYAQLREMLENPNLTDEEKANIIRQIAEIDSTRSK